MRIYEFAIGFGPPLLRWRRRGVLYSLRAFLLGGYVRIAGMDPEEDPNIPGGFMTRPLGARLLVLTAGAAMNVLAAVGIFCLMGMVLGVPERLIPEVNTVLENTPAARAGLLPGDVILGVNGQRYEEVEDIVKVIHRHPEEPIELLIQRGQRQLTLRVIPQAKTEYHYDPEAGKMVPERIGQIGIGFRLITRRIGMWESIRDGFLRAFVTTLHLLIGLWLMFTGRAPMALGGPVAIAKEISVQAQLGLYPLLEFASMISVNLAILNLLPLPALDGGRIAFQLLSALMERTRGHPLDPKKEAVVHLVGMLLLLGFIVYVTMLDIRRLVRP
jgi:regulator of sigma E protease